MPWSLGPDPIAGHQVRLAGPTYFTVAWGGVRAPWLPTPGLSQGIFRHRGAIGTTPGLYTHPLGGPLGGQPLGWGTRRHMVARVTVARGHTPPLDVPVSSPHVA